MLLARLLAGHQAWCGADGKRRLAWRTRPRRPDRANMRGNCRLSAGSRHRARSCVLLGDSRVGMHGSSLSNRYYVTSRAAARVQVQEPDRDVGHRLTRYEGVTSAPRAAPSRPPGMVRYRWQAQARMAHATSVTRSGQHEGQLPPCAESRHRARSCVLLRGSRVGMHGSSLSNRYYATSRAAARVQMQDLTESSGNNPPSKLIQEGLLVALARLLAGHQAWAVHGPLPSHRASSTVKCY